MVKSSSWLALPFSFVLLLPVLLFTLAGSNHTLLNILTVDPPPAAPADLRTNSPTKNQLNLLWQDNSDNETGFRLEYRLHTADEWQFLDNLPPNSHLYAHWPVAPGVPYYYRIRAYNDSEVSDWSNTGRGVGADVTVTSSQDTGSASDKATVGKLSNALQRASELEPGSVFYIGFNLGDGTGTVSITGTLPPVVKGVKISGFCEGGPEIILAGNGNTGLELQGVDLFGLELSGFSGPALKAQYPTNTLRCVKVSR